MDLLPTKLDAFRCKEYWDAFFRSRGPDVLEWYGNFEDFAPVFSDCISRGSGPPTECGGDRNNNQGNNRGTPPAFQCSVENTEQQTAVTLAEAETTAGQRPRLQGKRRTTNDEAGTKVNAGCRGGDARKAQPSTQQRILHVGCGNSELPRQLTNNGYGTIVNVDFSSVVIERMKKKHRRIPTLKWDCFDIRGTPLEDRYGEATFDAVLDKGFLDALLSSENNGEGVQPGLTNNMQKVSWPPPEEKQDRVGKTEEEEKEKTEKKEEGEEEAGRQEGGEFFFTEAGGGGGGKQQQDATQGGTEEQRKSRGTGRGTDGERCEMQRGSTSTSAAAPSTLFKEEAQEYLLSAMKVLKPGGKLIIISLAQDYVVKEIVRRFYNMPVNIKVYPLPLAASLKRAATAGEGQSTRPPLLPFVFCVEKNQEVDRRTEGREIPVSLAPGPEEDKSGDVFCATRCVMKPELGRATCDEEFVIWDLPKKIWAVMKWRVLHVAVRLPEPGTRSIVAIHRSGGLQSADSLIDELPRYVVGVYDVKQQYPSCFVKAAPAYPTKPTAAILVAPGEEGSWLFSSAEGNEELARQAGAKRILVVTRGSLIPDDQSEYLFDGNFGSQSETERMSAELGPYLADLALPGSISLLRPAVYSSPASGIRQQVDMKRAIGCKYFCMGNIPLMIVGSATARVLAELARERSAFAGWITVRDVEVLDRNDFFGSSSSSLFFSSSSFPASSSSSSSSYGMRRRRHGAANRSRARREHHNNTSRNKRDTTQLVLRQMLFSCNPHTIQSEIKLVRSARRGPEGDIFESTRFAFLEPMSEYHVPIAAAFALLREARGTRTSESPRDLENRHLSRVSAVLLGLGGGVLSMFLHCLFGEALDLELTCVDIDPVVINIARNHFGFAESSLPPLHCVQDDACAYLQRLPPQSVHVIVVDVNSSSASAPLKCPAEDFLEEDMLNKMKAALAPGGLLVFNLLCRCSKTKTDVIQKLSCSFPSVSSIRVSKDVNEVVVCQVDGEGVELPARRGAFDRHLRELVQVLENCVEKNTANKEGILKCAGKLLNCARDWHVQSCRDAFNARSD